MEKIAVSRFVVKEFRTAEAFKTLRTNLMFSGADVKAVALTSFSAAEGKSMVSFQLAASLAQAGKQVLLVDADLRKSVMVSRMRVRRKIEGLSHYLSGMVNANEILYKTDIPGLYLVFAGAHVPNAAELLGNASFDKLIAALKNTFDYVIVDAAPVGQVIDCAVMASAMDGVIMVVDTTHNSFKLERRIKQQLEKSGAKILGVILNRVDLAEKNSYYGKAYGYSYDSGDGSSEEDN
ncbi:MAG: polysaccharide biosynthesis tyrosine autokinase [Oscillospiraceae bacterium]|nr:polysaccharide biosynthesis tyrosine autokinase [Oscillospiraceae bacterium]